MNPMRRVFAFIFTLLVVAGLAGMAIGNAAAEGTPEISAAGVPAAGTTLTASKTAYAHWERTFHWTIDKSVTPGELNMFTGDQGQVQYTIAVTKDAGSDAYWVDGEICVTNGGAVATENLQIIDQLTMPPSQTVIASVNVDLSANPVLDPGESYCYPYRVDIPSGSFVAGATYKDTANITITNHSGHLDTPFGPSPSATSVMVGSPTLINSTIHVDDSNGQSFTFSGSGSQTYTETFTCDADKGQHDNTATIVETGQSDSASVMVNCYALDVSKTADPSFTRTYNWTIDKSADQSALTLALGQDFLVSYTVSLNATPVDSDWAAAGQITVHNPAPIDATVNGVSDVVSDSIAATVDCAVTFPYTLPAGGDLVCSYSADLPDASARTNTATATLQNYSYDFDGNATENGTTDFTGTKDFNFDAAVMTEVDEVVGVSDSYAGFLGTLNAGDAQKTFMYSRAIGPYDTCGSYTVDNTASFVTNDTGATGSGSWTVDVNVPCGGGCTLTIGYWKTHAGFTGNNADMVSALLPIWLGTDGSAKSVQVTNAAQAVELLNMSGDAANGINKLYAQLLAAKLNIASGASDSAVSSAIAAADSFLATHNAADWGSLSKKQQAQVLSWMTTLDNFNNGLIGPGYCSM